MYECFKIDSDVPPPRERTYPQQKYPFDEMEVGDSFFVPSLPGIVSSPWDRIYNALYRWRRNAGTASGGFSSSVGSRTGTTAPASGG